jgi:hypothetical protein
MDKKNSPNIGHNKKSLLNNPVEHIDIKSFDARKIIDGMGKMSLLLEIQLEQQEFIMKCLLIKIVQFF